VYTIRYCIHVYTRASLTAIDKYGGKGLGAGTDLGGGARRHDGVFTTTTVATAVVKGALRWSRAGWPPFEVKWLLDTATFGRLRSQAALSVVHWTSTVLEVRVIACISSLETGHRSWRWLPAWVSQRTWLTGSSPTKTCIRFTFWAHCVGIGLHVQAFNARMLVWIKSKMC